MEKLAHNIHPKGKFYTRKNLSLFLVLFVISTFSLYGQDRLIFSNNIYLRMDGQVFLVIDNPNNNAITLNGSGGNIISENEDNIIKWTIGSNTGLYNIPFTDTLLNKIPMQLNVTNAGNGGATNYVNFATYHTIPNNYYWPSGVTCFSFGADCNLGVSNDSLDVLDRFWTVGAIGFTTKPTVTMSFSFPNTEFNSPNTITPSNLKARRFNIINDDWEINKQFGTPTIGAVISTINAINLTPPDFLSTWTLSDIPVPNPLPVELSDFYVDCYEGLIKIKWITDTENNNDYFSIESSIDGIHFIELSKVKGKGNSTQKQTYTYTDNRNLTGEKYYRLRQVDFNGDYSYSNIVTAFCQNTQLKVWPNPSQGIFHFSQNETFKYITNQLGEILFYGTEKSENIIDLTNYRIGIYYAFFEKEGRITIEKIVKN